MRLSSAGARRTWPGRDGACGCQSVSDQTAARHREAGHPGRRQPSRPPAQRGDRRDLRGVHQLPRLARAGSGQDHGPGRLRRAGRHPDPLFDTDEPIAPKDERYPHLFPEFLGCDIDCGLHTILVFSDRHTRALSDRDLRSITDAPAAHGLITAVEVYAAEITAMAEENRIDVFLVARPPELKDTLAALADTATAA
jgi:hypothetical protein